MTRHFNLWFLVAKMFNSMIIPSRDDKKIPCNHGMVGTPLSHTKVTATRDTKYIFCLFNEGHVVIVDHTVHHHSIIIIEEKKSFHAWKTNTQHGAFHVSICNPPPRHSKICSTGLWERILKLVLIQLGIFLKVVHSNQSSSDSNWNGVFI